MPSEASKKALKDGLITQKQYDKLPPHLLEAVVKSKNKGVRKVAKNKKDQEAKSKPKARKKQAKRVKATTQKDKDVKGLKKGKNK